MIHQINWRVASPAALDFWEERLEKHGVSTARNDDTLRFDDPEGLTHELAVVDVPDKPLRARHPEIPEEHALLGFDGVRAYASRPEASAALLAETLNFSGGNGEWTARGDQRGSYYVYDEAPAEPGIEGAGSVHHVAWASSMDEHQAWRERVAAGGMNVTPIIDRYYFKSIYFREPSGVLFEIATIGPGFDVDEPIEHLGESLALPPNYQHLRSELEKRLTPLPDPRAEALRR
jgi:glyoxalase family protein